jgi:hypothetical protein
MQRERKKKKNRETPRERNRGRQIFIEKKADKQRYLGACVMDREGEGKRD